MKNFLFHKIGRWAGITAAAVFLTGWAGITPVWASGVEVQIERIPGIGNKTDGEVRLGTIHISEDKDMPDVMVDGDFLELVLPEGVIWDDRTAVYLQQEGSRDKIFFEEDEEYSFGRDRYLNISLNHVSDSRDILTVEPWVELDGFSGGKLYVSIHSDLLGPGTGQSVPAGQSYQYDVTAASAAVAEGTAGALFTPSPFTLQEACEGSFRRGEKIALTLPEGFVLPENNHFIQMKVLAGSDIFGTPERKNDTTIVVTVERSSSSPVRVEFTLKNVQAPENFSGALEIQAQGSIFNTSTVIAQIEKAEEETVRPHQNQTGVQRSTGGIFWMGTRQGVIHGNSIDMGAAPYIKQGRAYLPVRYVAYALGIEEDGIQWDADLEMVTLTKGGTSVKMKIGNPKIMVNDSAIRMDTAPEITQDYTMLPVRWVVEAFGGDIEWNEEPPMMTIYTYDDK